MTSPRPDADTSATGSGARPEPPVRGDDSGAGPAASATSKMVIAACDAYRKWCNRLNYVGAMRRAVEAALDAAAASPAIAQPHRLEAAETRPDVEGLVKRLKARADTLDWARSPSMYSGDLDRQAAAALSAYEARVRELTRERDEDRAQIELEPFGSERGERWPGKPPTARALAACIADLAINDRNGLIQRVMFILRRDRATVRAKHEARAAAAEKALEGAQTLLIKADGELSMIEGVIAGIGQDFSEFQGASKKLGANAIRLLNSVQDRVALGITPCAADARTAISSTPTALEQKPEGEG